MKRWESVKYAFGFPPAEELTIDTPRYRVLVAGLLVLDVLAIVLAVRAVCEVAL